MTSVHTSISSENSAEHQSRALPLIGLFVVIICAFLLHFNLVQAPFQGSDFALFFFDDVYHHPGTALSAFERLPGAPLSGFMLGLFWRLGNESIVLIRLLGVIVFAISAGLIFQLARSFSADRESVVAPLLCGLLFSVSPAAPGMLAESGGVPVALGLCFALAACVLYMGATSKERTVDWLLLSLSCLSFAVAFAAHHAMIAVPAVFALLDAARSRTAGKPGVSLSWTALAVSICVAGTLYLIAHVSGGATPIYSTVFPHAGWCLGVLAATWLIGVLPVMLARRVLIGAMAALVLAGAVYGFMQALRHMDPVLALEQSGAEDDARTNRLLALHYLRAASAADSPDMQTALLRQAGLLWPGSDEVEDRVFRMRCALQLLALGENDEVKALLTPTLAQSPFNDHGHHAALLLARTMDLNEDAAYIADLYAYAGVWGAPAPDDALRHALALAYLGALEQAASVFEFTSAQQENTLPGMMQKQTRAARDAARTLRDKAREQLIEDAAAATGYVTLAEAELVTGNLQRAFYWLELAMRRDKNAPSAWELMGVIFARHNQAEHFIAHWGDVKVNTPQAWLPLARQAAHAQSWDAALAFAYQAHTGEPPSPEEYLAAFALEMQRPVIADDWLQKAIDAHPDAYGPWLFKTDIALSRQQFDEALRTIEEARRRNAPEEEIEKRDSLFDAPDGYSPETSQTFEPVRSVIQ